MGYQEFTFKLDQPQQFIQQKKNIDKYMNKKDLSYLCEYTLIEVKQQIGKMDKGLYVYVTGERYGGRELLKYLDKKLQSSYKDDIESCLGLWKDDNRDNYVRDSVKLTKLFKNKRSEVGNVLIKGPERNIEMERSLF